MKLKKGDTVFITAGKDNGREGKIVAVLPKEGKVIVEGINKYKKHIKPRGEGQTGSIQERERPISVASVAFMCPKCKQASRIGYKNNRDGKKIRICRKCEENLI
ncbi:50S ribosomal protein L24 [Candidatus Collierbacteria bacterium]|nr:50S ribosomal protein L24 [Candidatus Collierbacteria bacterium]